MPVPAAQILVAVLTHIGGPLMPLPAPEPAYSPAEPTVKISIADDIGEVTVGQPVRYQVIVSNTTVTEAAITVKLTLSPAMITELQSDNAAVVANAVAWKHMLPAGETRTYSVAGVVDSKVKAADLAATACVHLTAEAPALTCATDMNVVSPESTPRTYAWLAALFLGLLAVAGSVWLQKKITPELLTPSNAAAALGDDPGQPGGAPPV
ncbi:MAG TPA: hypothetical protein DGG94_21080 [Micromonosporaceae bacterium]|nr:hypothetical protein [Micromonosporaceae bacterium]HCU52255.1 hypothetical protein [Micromonosporaceae bacterium]